MAFRPCLATGLALCVSAYYSNTYGRTRFPSIRFKGKQSDNKGGRNFVILFSWVDFHLPTTHVVKVFVCFKAVDPARTFTSTNGMFLIIGIGTDVVEIDRIASSIDRFGNRFLEKVLTSHERCHLPPRPVSHIAGRFAAKEACVKALGTGFTQGIGFRNINVVSLDSGQPTIILNGPALARSESLGVRTIHLSITHGRDIASAVVILEGK
jgi:holo-[acyl-carrier protein] synthase